MWQKFQYLQVIGFTFLIIGTCIYNEIFYIPIAFFRRPPENPQSHKESDTERDALIEKAVN
jgi:hypothetical protein